MGAVALSSWGLRWLAGLAATVAVAGVGPAPVGSSPSDQTVPPSEALSTFLARGAQLPLPYRAHRRLEAVNHRFNKKAWLEATTAFDPSTGFAYAVIDEEGSSLVRGSVLRAALETEAKTIASGATVSAVTADNYVITDAGEDETGLVRLRLQPRRKDQFLIDGFVLVTPGQAAVVRIEGRLAKSPSFWITRVEIVRRYESVLGFNVPIEVTSQAQMRIFGASSFRMHYRYESIDGKVVPASEQPADPPPLSRGPYTREPPEDTSDTEPDDLF